MGKQVVKTFPFDAKVSVEMTGAFVARLHQLQHYMIAAIPPDQAKRIMEDMKNEMPADPMAFHLVTVFALIRDAEDQFKSKGLTVDKEVDLPG